MIRDANIDWKRKSKLIRAESFALATDGTSKLVSPDTGAATMVEVTDLGFSGLAIGAGADKMAAVDFETIREIDTTEEVGVRILWLSNTAPALSDAILFAVHYDQFDVGEVVVPAASVLDTAILVQSPSSTSALQLHRTSRGVINANTFDDTARAGGLSWEINVGTFTDFEANQPIILGLEIDYIPRICVQGTETPGLLNSDLAVG